MLNRVIARFFNYALSFLLLFVFAYPIMGQSNPQFYLYSLPIIFLFTVFIEAFCLSKWSTTPGHALFGFTFKGLSYSNAIKFLFGRKKEIEILQNNVPKLQKYFGTGFVAIALTLFFLGGMGGSFGGKGSKHACVAHWENYYCTDKGFSVDFPTCPLFEEKVMEIARENKTFNYVEYSSCPNGTVHYKVSYVDFPSSWKLVGSKVLLKEFFNVLVESEADCDLITKEFSEHEDYRCLDYHIQQGSEEIIGRLIVVKNTLYRLTVTFPSSEVANLDEGLFLNSFTVE